MNEINPDYLITDKETFLVVLDSRNASVNLNSPFNSSIVFDFEDSIRVPQRSLKMSCSVLSFTCPNSIYVVNETNNNLNIRLSGNTFQKYIPYGNYDANTFQTILLSQLTPGFTMSFNTITNIYTLNFTSDFTILPSSIGEIMGFNTTQSYTSYNGSLTMPYTVNFNGLQNLNINFANLNTKNMNSYTKSNSSIIQPIPIITNSSQILYQKTNNYEFLISQNVIDFIQIDLTDDLDRLVNLNNQHFNLTLVFSIVQDKNRFEYEQSFSNIIKFGHTLHHQE